MSVRVEIEINAPVDHVWQILLDFESYGAWNSFTPRIEGVLEVGNPVNFDVKLKGKMSNRTEHVTRIDHDAHTVCWGMHILHPTVFRAERCQVLTPLEGGRTHYVSSDSFDGPLKVIVSPFFGPAVEEGFNEMAVALKARAEADRRHAADAG
jgi:hypothetical protein